MGTFFVLAIVGVIVFGIFKIATTSGYKATDDSFSQAGITVIFSTGKVTIKGRTYDAKDITGLEWKQVSKLGTEVYIKVDDFKKPLHKIGITGFGAGEKFVQRFSTALRKAGGSSFY